MDNEIPTLSIEDLFKVRKEFLTRYIQVEVKQGKDLELVLLDVLSADIHVLGHHLHQSSELARRTFGLVDLVCQQ